ncbi:MAG: biotin/lipoyl-binding protein [Prevotella sp.]|nr:biotin/lipoyl-binding protein [Prevotella sp.]
MNKYEYKVQGVDYTVEIEDVEGNIAKVNVNGIPFEVEMKQPIKAAPKVKKVEPAKVEASKVATPAAAPVAAPAAAATPGAGAKVTAPLPGTITDVKVAVGQSVNAGDVVVILEAMKMQNNIEAENSGTVTSVMVNKGDTVMEGTVLVTIG